jgi:putative ABC transport system substrate-binding protein
MPMGYPNNYGLKPSPPQADAGARQSWEVQMSICLRRREFIAGLGGAAAWPLGAHAQRPTMPVVALVSGTTADKLLAAFHKGMSETGYVEGQNVAYHNTKQQSLTFS